MARCRARALCEYVHGIVYVLVVILPVPGKEGLEFRCQLHSPDSNSSVSPSFLFFFSTNIAS
jgi:hypothetical protein